MNFIAAAGQREMGQHEPAGSTLLRAFSVPSYETLNTQRERFAKLADVVRHCSDNFLPDEFAKRVSEELARGWSPLENLELMIKCNAKALKALEDHMDVMKAGGLFSDDEMLGYSTIISEQADLKEAAEELFSHYKSENAASQPGHNAV